MGYEDVIDGLIAEGYKKVTLGSHMLITEGKLSLPGCDGWTILHWPVAPSRSSDLKEIWGIDLTQRDEAVTRLCLFS